MNRSLVVALLGLTALGAGCQDVPLRAVNRTVAVEGRFCTNDSASFGVPLRILLVVDTSKSMEVNDPSGFRGKAATRLVDGLLAKGLEASFAFVHFNTAAQALTPSFLKDRAQLGGALGGLNAIEGFTNYLDALGQARTLINADLIKTAQELKELEKKGIDTRYRRPWYFVVFLSDGIPRMPGGVLQSTDSILFQVDQLVQAPPEAMGITLHTAFLGAADDVLRPEAEVLLKKMAVKGRGSYFSFTRGEQIDFNVFDFQVKRLFDIKQVLVYNRTAVLPDEGDSPLPDSDADGLADRDEVALGTDPLGGDSDGDGLGDGFEVRSALDPKKAGSSCSQDAFADGDHDGLNDCEENLLNLNRARFDSDGDLFPDRFELLSGTNAADPGDVRSDLDFDGVLAGDELRARTKVNKSDKADHGYYGQAYQVQRTFDSEKGVACYRYEVTGVPVVETQALGARPEGTNEVVVDFIETPEDQPEQSFTLQRAVLEVPYLGPAARRLALPEDPFQPVSTQEVPRR